MEIQDKIKKMAKHLSYLPVVIFLVSCGDSGIDKKASENLIQINSAESSTKGQQNSIIGEWEQQYTCLDKNSNYKLDPGEKTPTGTKLGFNWFKFNADATCLRDRDIKFKGTYEVQDNNGTPKLEIQGGDNLRYKIIELTDSELILGTDGTFMVFSRII